MRIFKIEFLAKNKGDNFDGGSVMRNMVSDKKRYIDDNQTNESEFELNYYKKEKDLRKSYLNKLINKGIWAPNNEEKKYNSIIIFDWDDTLLPTSFLVSKGIFDSDIEYTKYEKQKLIELEDLILQLLTLAVDKGDVYIITNADKGWVEYSSRIFYPSAFFPEIMSTP